MTHEVDIHGIAEFFYDLEDVQWTMNPTNDRTVMGWTETEEEARDIAIRATTMGLMAMVKFTGSSHVVILGTPDTVSDYWGLPGGNPGFKWWHPNGWLETLADPKEFAYSVMRMIEDLMHGIERCLTVFQHGLEMCLSDSAYYDAMAEEDRESFYRESFYRESFYYPRD